MSALGERAAKAQKDLADIEKALARTQTALHVVQNVDEVASEVASGATRRRRPILKILLILTIIGVVVVVVRKLAESQDTSPVQLATVEDRSPAEDIDTNGA